MIRVESLVKKYGGTSVVDGVSFELLPGEVVGFLGPNGAGKTTTLRMLSGYLWPSSGRVVVDGLDAALEPLECRRRIGYLPESNPLYEEMEVSECLEWYASVRGLSAASGRRALRDAVERCGLAGVIGRSIGELSRGYRQRVGIAAAILHDPPILLLDEPTSGLDPNQALELRGLIAELRTHKTVLLSTHILSEVRASCDRAIIIHRGKIVAQGSPLELAVSSSRERRLHLVLRSGTDLGPVREALSVLPGVASAAVLSRDGAESVSVAAGPEAGDLREPVFQLAVERGWPLLELYQDQASLEDVFRELTA